MHNSRVSVNARVQYDVYQSLWGVEEGIGVLNVIRSNSMGIML